MRREFPASNRRQEINMWTTGIYFKKYTHMVQIITDRGETDPLAWCKENLPKAYKSRKYGRKRSATITRFYCVDSGFNRLMSEFKDRVVEYSKPFNAEAEQQLLQGLTLELRDHLYYKKYRYSLHMVARDFDIVEWCKSNLGEYKKDYFHTYGGTGLYLKSEDELMHVKLALSEYIVFAKCAWLEDEVVKAIR